MILENRDRQTARTETAATSAYQWGWFDWVCLWYPPGWLILFNRHWQHYYPDPDGWIWPEYLLFLIPGGFYLALGLRWLRLGCRLPHKSKDVSFDPRYQAAFRDEILAKLVKHYFRAELYQSENLPEQGPLMIAMNHAGMCFPWDFLSLATLLGLNRGWTVQPLADMSLFEHPWIMWWLPPEWSQVLGGVQAQSERFEAAIAADKPASFAHNSVLLYAPEGLRGPRKGWRQRYQLETFHPSFMRLSDRYQMPVLPVACLGSESLHPWAWHFQALAKWLKMPFLPLSPLMLVFLLFPSMGVWARRSQLNYYIQPLLQPSDQGPDQSRSLAYDQAAALRAQLQTQIDQLLSGAQ